MPFASMGSFHAMARMPAVMPMMNIAPVGVTILSSTATSITISFTPPHGVVTGYTPYVNGVAGTGSGTPASYTITGLTAGQTYSIMMQATMSIGGGVTNFLPTSIPGCSVWLDAADSSTITLNGSGVSQWRDKSTNGFLFTQSTAGNQPTYSTNSLNGQATLQFTAANSTYLGGGTNYAVGTNSFAIFAVFKFSDTTSNGSVFCKSLLGSQQGRIYFLRESNGTFNFRVTDPVGDNNQFTDTYAGNTYRIMCMTYNRTAGAGFVFNNGTLVSSYTADKTTNLTNTNTFIIGGYNNGSGTASPPTAGFYLNGNIAEIICYTNSYDMTLGIQQQIEGYLASKWGIRSYLNTSHPFYSVPALTNAYSVFTPKSISGLNVWWDGADPNGTGVVPVNGATINTWVDKSGNGYNATASVAGTYSSSPVGVNFGTTGYYTTSYPANPTNESCFIVFNKSSNNQMMMIGTAVGGREVAMQSGTIFGTVNSKVGWSATMSAGSATGVTHLGEVFVSGGTSTYVNFNGAVTLTGPSAVTAFTSGILTNLGREAGAEFQYLGYIQEILFYNSVLTLSQRQLVEGYLAWKWGVQTNLPVAHPYYSTSALNSVVSNTMTYSSAGSVVKSATTVAVVLQTNTFAYTGANQTVTVPVGTTYVTAQLWGAGGGGAGNGSNSLYNMTLLGNGGGGGYTSANLTVTAGTTLTVIVGQAGSCSATAGAAIAASYGGGGAALSSDGNWRQTSGGGRSAIQISSADIITAGGGGGGGKMGDTPYPTNVTGYTANGGAGGGLIGGDGGAGDPDTSFQGKGGTQSAGGAAAVNSSGGTAGTAGSQYQGGGGGSYGAAGGGGWYGGGGGNYYLNTNGQQFGAGGGGSSYVSPTYLKSGTTATLTQASGKTVAANSSLPAGVQGTIGAGGTSSSTGGTGQNGYVVLTFY